MRLRLDEVTRLRSRVDVVDMVDAEIASWC